jgi:ADP-ribose pyrophosphatase
VDNLKTISRQNIFNGKVIKVYNDEVELSDGRRTTREVVSHKEAVAVVAVNDRQEVLLVTQFRYPIHKDLIELPAGLIDAGEVPLEAAKRELKEETGYEAEEWELLTSAFSSPGSHDEVIHIFAASGLKCVSGQCLDVDEELTFAAVPFEEILGKVRAGTIRDGKTIIGILLYFAKYLNEANK